MFERFINSTGGAAVQFVLAISVFHFAVLFLVLGHYWFALVCFVIMGGNISSFYWTMGEVLKRENSK